MPKFLSSVVLDAAATVITDNAMKLSVLSAAPLETSGATAIIQCDTTSGYMLAVTTLTTGLGSTSWALSDSTGRMLTVSQQATIAIAATGVAAFIALYSTVTSRVYAYTSCATQALSDTANKVTIPAWTIRFAQAT